MKIKSLIVGCFLVPQVIFAQTVDKDTKEYIENRFVQHGNAIKFDPVRMIIGDIAFSYERVVGQKTSVEVELGPTLSHVGLNRLAIGDAFDDGNSFGSAQSGLGAFGSIAFRYYVLNNRPAMNQLYISPKYKFRQYNELISDGGAYNLDDVRGKLGQHIMTFNIGMQFWVSKSFSLDCYIGFGFASNQRTNYWVVEDFTTNPYSYTWDAQNKKSVNMTVSTGLKLGIGFK